MEGEPVVILLRFAVALCLGLGACTYSSETAPQSGPATIGVSISYSVYTECGFRLSLFDLDGSLWTPVDVDPAEMTRVPAGFESPDDEGTITLMSPERAEYRSSQGRVLVLARHEGNLEQPSGCS